jgi:hypothetical protein
MIVANIWWGLSLIAEETMAILLSDDSPLVICIVAVLQVYLLLELKGAQA